MSDTCQSRDSLLSHQQLRSVQPFCGRWFGTDDYLSRDKYIFPVDEEEMERLDIFHKFFLVARGNVLFSSPLDLTASLHILDLGTGTGIWPIMLSEAHPHFTVLGLDMNMIQPRMIPATMKPPEELDIEDDWGSVRREWDLIHARTLFGSVGCWEDMYKKIYRHLKPGKGYFEQVEIDWLPRCDDHSLPATSALVDWTNKLLTAMDKHGRSMRVIARKTKQELDLAGFENIDESVIKVCYNHWSVDPQERITAAWFNVGFCHALAALSYGPMVKILGMSKSEVDELCALVKNELYSEEYRAYCTMCVVQLDNPLIELHSHSAW